MVENLFARRLGTVPRFSSLRNLIIALDLLNLFDAPDETNPKRSETAFGASPAVCFCIRGVQQLGNDPSR
jgi:hypothetical protein